MQFSKAVVLAFLAAINITVAAPYADKASALEHAPEPETRGGVLYSKRDDGDLEPETRGGVLYSKRDGGELEPETRGGVLYSKRDEGVPEPETRGGVLYSKRDGGDLEPETRGGVLYSKRDEGELEPETRGGVLYSSKSPVLPVLKGMDSKAALLQNEKSPPQNPKRAAACSTASVMSSNQRHVEAYSTPVSHNRPPSSEVRA
ncbi:MAG: hypothetical protein Q9174_002224 [Haloplaca sp. 1 TL-2023]